MESYKAAIFDLDGTLLDTLDDLADSGNAMLRQLGHPTHPTEAFRTFVGDGVRVLMERIVPQEAQTPEHLEECARIYQGIYAERWNSKTRPYPGIPELLNELDQRGIQLAVLSNKPQHFTEQCIAHFLGDWHWKSVLGFRDHVPKKPDPAGAQEILQILELLPSNCLYLGDTNVDMQTACAANLYPVGVLWGFRDEAELVENGAETILRKPLDLLPLLESV